MPWFRYLQRELIGRRVRSFVVVASLALGVTLVIGLSAVSDGIGNAQQEALDPLGTLGTELQLTRPIEIGGTGFLDLSPQERTTLERENGRTAFDFSGLGDPGDRFERDVFLPATQLTFPSSVADEAAALDHVEGVSPSLTLLVVRQSGTVPETTDLFDPSNPSSALQLGNLDVDFETITVAAFPPDRADVAPVSERDLQSGEWFRPETANVMLGETYARRLGIGAGDRIKLADRSFPVTGVVATPLGGRSADVYLPLGQLQQLAGRPGRINLVGVRADRSENVPQVRTELEGLVEQASVSGADDVAGRVDGSLVDAADMADRLGSVLAGIAIAAATLLAILVTWSGVVRRTRELGTLRAIGWTRRRVIRQVMVEAVVLCVLGALLGLGVGLAATKAVDSRDLSFEVRGKGASLIEGLPGGAVQQLGGTGADTGDRVETVRVRVRADRGSATTAALAAIAAGVLAGALGAWRAARLRPAEAFRGVE
ncbi:MAG: ABC transporter permease [Thermoleophilia bacterium]|nr:ABC transporter permease [Thermoleophilia bacterium]